jgi:iron complex transport system substrate-binding protein
MSVLMKLRLRRWMTLLLSTLTVASIAGCFSIRNIPKTSDRPVLKECRMVQHDMGSTCIPKHPQRIVALEGMENSLALGFRPIAYAQVKGFPVPQYLRGKLGKIESVGDFNSPNLEKILLLKPDLIIARRGQGNYEQLSHIAPTIILDVPFPPPPWKQEFEKLAKALGKQETAERLLNEYWQRVAKLKQALGDRGRIMKVSIANTSPEYGIWSYGEKHFSGSVLADIGLQRPDAQRGDFFYIENLSKETLLSIDGDALFFTSWGRADDKKTLEKLKRGSLWLKLKVVQNNRVYAVGGHWHNSDILAINAILDDLENYLVHTP